jgi:hypothetical protein
MPLSYIDQWLIAEGAESGRWFVVHTQPPEFIVEILDREDGGYESGEVQMREFCADASLLARLMREAGEQFARYDADLQKEQKRGKRHGKKRKD